MACASSGLRQSPATCRSSGARPFLGGLRVRSHPLKSSGLREIYEAGQRGEAKTATLMTAPKGAFRRAKLQYTGRAFRQDADQAMRSDIFRGLVEAITNADDAYAEREGEIVIRVHRAHGRVWSVGVLDQATGIPLNEMERRLGTLGARTSGYERGARVRGNRGRGAKDLAAYGAVRWDSIVDGAYGVMEIERDGRYRIAREAEPAPRELRERLGIGENGTLVTISCRGNVTRPRFETMVNKLERLVPLRGIMQDLRRSVTLTYLDEATIQLRYAPDDTLKHVAHEILGVQDYAGAAELNLYESREPLVGGPGDPMRENGILIESGRAVHEATLFGFEMDPYGALFTGSVRWETIDQLVREFDERDEHGREPSRSNPFSIVSRMRDGLEKTHPAYEALRRTVEPILGEHIERRRAEDANLAAETPQTRRRLNRLARIVTEFSLDKEEELDIELSAGTGGESHAPALRIVPHVKHLQFGETATLSVIARRDVVRALPATVEIEVGSEPPNAITASPLRLVLEEDRAVLRASLSVQAGSVLARGTIVATIDGVAPCSAEIKVVEPLETEGELGVSEPEGLCFEHAHYNVAVGKRRLLRVLAPSEIVALHGTALRVRCENPQALEVRDDAVSLRPCARGTWYQSRVCVEGKQYAPSVAVVARLGDALEEAATTLVVGSESSGPAMTIEIGQFAGAARARWQRSPDGNVTITINAAHPAALRYMGTPPDFPGQESPLARMLVAEIVAEEVVRDLLSRRYRGGRVDADAYAADRLRLLADLLPRCHAAQITDAEAENFIRQDGKPRRPDLPEKQRGQPELF